MSRVSSIVPSLMAQRATAKAFPDVLKLLDRAIAAEFREQQAVAASGKPQKKSPYNPYPAGQMPYVQLYGANNSVTHAQISFPLPNRHFSLSEIQVLRNAYALYQAADLTSDLIQHFETAAKRPETPPAELLPWQLALAYLHWWNDSQDIAVEQLRNIAKSLPEDQEFKLDLAEVYAARGDFSEGLELVNAITPLDQDVMQRREKLALRMAMQSGETERAREAAARLFGLRLDAETQVQLASQMKQLGMHEQAEAVMARAGRQAGNRLAALLSLMREFQSQGKPDMALQIAQSILRRTQARGPVARNQGTTEAQQARQQAVQFLAGSGKLKELIARVESQLKNSPKSIQLHQSLVEYHTAAGNREESKKWTLKLAELNQNDPQARWQVAMQLLQSGETDKSVEHLKAALKQQPGMFANNYYEVTNAFRQAKKIPELVKILDEIDLKKLGQSHVVMNVVQQLFQEEGNRDLGLKLFQRVWEAYPIERTNMMAYVHNDALWQTPEIYTYARQAFIPQDGQALTDPWSGFTIRSYGSEGRVEGGLNYMLRAAKKQNKLADLEKEIGQALEKQPAWRGGQAMLAIILLQRGEEEGAIKRFEEVLGNKEKGLPSQAAWLIGQELNAIPKGELMAIKFYQHACLTPDNNGTRDQFRHSPESALVTLYVKNGQKDLARELLLKAAARKPNENYNGAEYAAYQKIETQVSIGDQIQKMGFALDAVKIFTRVANDQASLELAKQWGGDQYAQRAKQGLATALKAIGPEQLAGSFQSMLQSPDSVAKDPEAPAVDLFLSLEATSTKSIRVASLLTRILEQSSKVPAVCTEIGASLAKLQKDRPEDVSILITDCLLALQDKEPASLAKSAEQLDQWVTAHTLEMIAEDKRANSRQRTIAERQIPLWLVARECLKLEPLRAIGGRLGARAAEAARRQLEREYLLAIVKEQGQLAWDAGDKVAAEAHWTEMLELIMTRPPALSSQPGGPVATAVGAGGVFVTVPVRVAPAGAPLQVSPKRAEGTAPATVSQFNQIIDVAKFAASNELHAFSFKAVRMALRGGPPVTVDPNANNAMASHVVRSSAETPINVADIAVENGIWELQKLWRQHKAPAEEAFAVLSEIVFPKLRPEEILLYTRPLPNGVSPEPRSVGLILVKQAVQLHKEKELKEQIGQRTKSTAGAFHGQLLLTTLAIESKDIPQAKTALEELAKQFEKRPLQDSAELAYQATLPALDIDELAASAAPILTRAVKQLTTVPNRNGDERHTALLLRLAELNFKVGQPAAGKTLLNDYLAAVDATYQNYGGDYGQHMHRQAVQRMANQLVKAGQLEDALQRLGEVADSPKTERYGGTERFEAGPALVKQLQERPALERYKLLKAWTLPVAGRKTLRMINTFGAAEEMPQDFIKGLLQAAGAKPAKPGLLSTVKLLVEAAKEADKLDDLATAVQPLVDEKVEYAAELMALIKIAQKKPAESVPGM